MLAAKMNGPDLVRSEIVLDDEQGSLIGPVLRKGRPNEGMPAFDLSDAQIQDLAAFLRERTQAAINRNAYPLQNLLTGRCQRPVKHFSTVRDDATPAIRRPAIWPGSRTDSSRRNCRHGFSIRAADAAGACRQAHDGDGDAAHGTRGLRHARIHR